MKVMREVGRAREHGLERIERWEVVFVISRRKYQTTAIIPNIYTIC